MAIDVEKIKDMAEDAIEKVASDKTAKETVNKVINEVEKKTKFDLPDVDSIAKSLK